MCVLRTIIFVFFFFLSLPYIGAQELASNLKGDIFDLMKEHATSSKDRKQTKKFFRTLNSNDFPSEINLQTKLVLLDFYEKKLGFQGYYLNFFTLVMECEKKDNYILLNAILNFLLAESLSNLELKKFLKYTNNFLKFQILNQTDLFRWECLGDVNFSINDDFYPVFNFSNADLMLFNKYDTVHLLQTQGVYNILERKFQGSYAKDSFFTDDLLVDFTFDNFTIDLNKQFFQISNASIATQGVVEVQCFGSYKNKLTSSKNYPVFTSNSDVVDFLIFDFFQMNSGFEMRGGDFFFNKDNNHTNLSIIDDNMHYGVMANSFELSKGVISSSSSRFIMRNDSDSIYHPLVAFSYNDNMQKIYIDRLSGARGLNPIRNTFHGLNMFADRMEIDLVYDNCLLFHYAPGRDIEVLFESNTFFDKKRYSDLFRFDLNVFGLLYGFLEKQNDHLEVDNYDKEYSIVDFASFGNLPFSDAWDILVDFEIFGLVDCYRFGSFFKVKPWAFNFVNAADEKYDYDVFKIESLAGIGDTVAEIDLYLNTMDIYRVRNISITNRYDLSLYPMSNRVQFFNNKSFRMDGNIYVGNFAFSGKNVLFDYDTFSFHFGKNSILSFLKPDVQKITSSLIHFDSATLLVDSVNNKSGAEFLNDFPKFQNKQNSFLSYNNNPVQFLLNPMEINYLHDMSLTNLSFTGNLYLDGDSINAPGVLLFDREHNLETVIEQDSLLLYRGKLKLHQAKIFLNKQGLFASGFFSSKYLNFSALNIELSSKKIIGKAEDLKSGPFFHNTPFFTTSALLHHSPYDDQFLIKTRDKKLTLYQLYSLKGDLYFDGKNLNGSGAMESDFFSIESSHYYYSHNNIMSADADFSIYDSSKKNTIQFLSEGVSLEHEIDKNSFFITKSTHLFSLPLSHHLVDFDIAIFDGDNQQIQFYNNNSKNGKLTSLKYGKKPFSYFSSSAEYDCNDNQLCVYDAVLRIKKYWLRSEEMQFCLLKNGDFPLFKNASLIKKRWLFKDKIINNQDVMLKHSLKHSIIND